MSNIKTLTISGMSCGACQKVIEKRFGKVDGVHKVKVHVNEGRAEVETIQEIPTDQFHKALEGTQYQITNSN